MTLWYQCHLVEHTTEAPPRQTVAWIEERGAKQDALVEIPDYDNKLFRVAAVFNPPMEEAQLKAKQQADRKFGGSIR